MKDFPTILLIAILRTTIQHVCDSPDVGLAHPAIVEFQRVIAAEIDRLQESRALGSQLEELWGSPSWCPNPVPGPPRYAPHCPPRQPQAPIAAEGSRLLQRIVSRPQIVRCDI